MNDFHLRAGGTILLAILVIGCYYLYDSRGNYRYFGDEYSFESLPETLYNVKYYADDRGMIWVSYNNGTHTFYARASSAKWVNSEYTYDWQMVIPNSGETPT